MVEGVLAEQPLALCLDGDESHPLDGRRPGPQQVGGRRDDQLGSRRVEWQVRVALLRAVVDARHEVDPRDALEAGGEPGEYDVIVRADGALNAAARGDAVLADPPS